jgi:RecJ-like exonuclease
MTETVRCPSCRGAKKVPKLGGMIGECNTCKGSGTILACDKPKLVVAEVLPVVEDVIAAVSDCVTSTNVDIYLKAEEKLLHNISEDAFPLVEPIKVDPKKALYKRKQA